MLTLRSITPADNAAVAHVIRTVMPEFACVGDGFSINDPEVNVMAASYAGARSAFFVIEQTGNGSSATKPGHAGNAVVGCAGYAPLTGGEPEVCELRKMYILPEGRGQGGGRLLLDACIAGARAAGFEKMYLETVTAMTDAAAVYAKYGFKYIDWPLGDTGHGGCDRYMLKDLT